MQMARWLEAKGMSADLAQVGIICQDQYICYLRDAVCFPDGTMGTYVRLVDSDPTVPGVIVLPVYQGQVLYNPPFSSYYTCLAPGNSTWIWVTSEENAKRELEEEIEARP